MGGWRLGVQGRTGWMEGVAFETRNIAVHRCQRFRAVWIMHGGSTPPHTVSVTVIGFRRRQQGEHDVSGFDGLGVYGRVKRDTHITRLCVPVC